MLIFTLFCYIVPDREQYYKGTVETKNYDTFKHLTSNSKTVHKRHTNIKLNAAFLTSSGPSFVLVSERL